MRNKNLTQILKTSVEFTKSEIENLKGELSDVLVEIGNQQEQMMKAMEENRKQLLETLVEFRSEQKSFMSYNKIEKVLEEGELKVVTGPKGPRGSIGPQGDKGDQGEIGKPFLFEDFKLDELALLKGEQGDIGPIGPQGVQGLQGERGFRGLQGAKGDIGEQGLQGDIGLTGAKGEDGLVGERGERGETGPRGAPGERGIQGIPGKDFNSQEVYEKVISQVDKMLSDLPEIEVNANDLTEVRNEIYKRMGNLQSRMVNLISSSAGSGEVLLAKMDDVDTTNIANQKILVYDSTAKKFIFQAKPEGTGSIDLGPLDPDDSGTITEAEFTAAVDDAVDDADIDGGTFS